MKRRIITLAILAMLLTVCVACNANATPAPAQEELPPVEKVVEPAQLSEKEEISKEALELIFSEVYTSEHDKHPDSWSEDFCITDEVGKINKAIPDDKKAPVDLRTQYTEWRAAQAEADIPAEPEPEVEPIAEQEPEVEQPTTSSNTDSANVSDSGGEGDWRSNMIIGDGPGQGDSSGIIPGDPSNITGNIGGSGDSDSSEQSEPAPTPEETSNPYPAGTTIQWGSETYTSTGELVNGGKWALFTGPNGKGFIKNIIDGTEMPCVPDNYLSSLDLSDGGASIADEMGTHSEDGPGFGSFTGSGG